MRTVLALFIFLAANVSSASAQGESADILTQLSGVHLDKGQIYRIRDITIRRDALSISLNRGTIVFLEPILGKVTGAVFVGSGEVISLPPDSMEKQQMHRFTGSPILNEPFRTALFRFTDGTYDEIMKEYRSRAVEDVEPGDAEQLPDWDSTIAKRSGWLNYRLLSDFLESQGDYFFAELDGEKLGWFNVTYDPRMVEEVAIIKPHENPEPTPYDILGSFNRRSEARDPEAAAAAADANKLPLDILSYDIDAAISAETQLTATATFRARALRAGGRVISFDLSRFLRVSSVSTSGGETIPVYQHQNMNEDEIRRYGVNAFVIVLPRPLNAGEEITLRFAYSGGVIEQRGAGVFYVGDRGQWYPNLGMQDRASFNLTFHYPAKYNLVATGSRVNEWEEAGLRHSLWKSNAEFGVAGFNFGDFKILADESGTFPIFVTVNNDVENIYKEIAAYRALQLEMAIRLASGATRRRGAAPVNPAIGFAPDYSVFDTRALAESILKEIRATASYFSDLFGSYPYGRLTVSQFPVNYSQGWPSLVYLSTLSFFDRTQREKLGMESDPLFLYTELVRAHEIAHQWFGNKVGWRSYRDQWISEAFSNYAGAMYVEHKYGDASRVREILEIARDKLLEQGTDKFTNDSRGPVSAGVRLVSAAAPGAYRDNVYTKGTWIVHMLRMLMREDGANSDEAFLKMIREFLETFDGKLASNWDLKHIAEKHMSKKLDWFFDQWVFGTGIPKYELDYEIGQTGGAFVIEGKILQKGVPEVFTMPVPLYADDEFLGRVEVSGEGGSFRFEVKRRPSRVLLDPYETVLKIPE
jgi:hypothetical protein